MKTKPKNFRSFFVRVGAGFLAFWLLSMGAFSLLLGQQRAELMAADIKRFCRIGIPAIMQGICWIPRSMKKMIRRNCAGC